MITRTKNNMPLLRILLILALASACIFGCVAPIKHEFSTDFPAWVLSAVGTPPVSDGRVRFREIFCQLLAEEPGYQDPSIPCKNFLLQLNYEPLPDGTPNPVPTRNPDFRYRVLVVPGFLNECFAGIALPFEDAIKTLNKNGFKIEALVVSGRSSSESNAQFIAETIENLDLVEDEKLLIVGHSKGAVDILHFLVQYPQASSRIAAVVSVAGAVNGSPLADRYSGSSYDNWFARLSFGRCRPGDGGVLDSLSRTQQFQWLATHPLPQHVRYYSLGAFARYENVQLHQRITYKLLEPIEPLNDGQLLYFDQIIPGATLLGYVNADHWTVAVTG